MNRSRRAFLRAAALAGVVGAAGCSQDEGTPTDQNPGNGDGGASGGGSPTATGTANATRTDEPGTGTQTEEPTDTATERPVGTSERWPSLQFDPANTGAVSLYHEEFTGAERNWTVEFDDITPLQPVFDEERLYVPTGGAVHALDRETRDRPWQVDLTDEAPATPAIDDRGFVYVVSGGRVLKLHGSEGWSAWEFTFTEEFPELVTVAAKSAPVLVGDTVVFNVVARKSSGSPGTVSRVVGLNAQTGDLHWQFETNRRTTEPATVYAPTPAVSGNTLYVTAGHDKRDAALYAVNTNNGDLRWSHDYKGKGWSSACVTDGVVYFADRYIQLFDTDGNQIVRRTVSPPPNAYAVAAGSEYVFMSSRVYEGNQGSLFAVNDRGRVEWTFEGEGNLYVPTATDEMVYVASGSGSLFALTQSDGLVRWEHDLGISGVGVASGPAISSEEIYVAAAPTSAPVTLFSVSPV